MDSEFSALEARKKLEETREEKFSMARSAMKDAEFTEASRLWRNYLSQYVGFPKYDEAQFYFAQTLFYLSKHEESLSVLQSLIESSENKSIYADARMLYAENLLLMNRKDEALAVTFETLQNKELEKKFGIKRKANPPALSAEEQIKVLTMRGRIFGELNLEVEAVRALAQARNRLRKVKAEKNRYSSLISWRQIETLNGLCKNKVPLPSKLSESEFLNYSENYYDCAEPAKNLFCDVKLNQDDQVQSQSLQAYKALVLSPMRLRDALPPPSRRVKEKQKPYYESEMKQLIEKEVTSRSQGFRNLEKCDAFNLF